MIGLKFTVYLLNGRGEVGLACRLALEDEFVPLPERVNKPGFGSIGTLNITQQKSEPKLFAIKL